MKKQAGALLLALMVLFTVLPRVSLAEEPVFSRLGDATAYVRRCADERQYEFYFYLTDPKVMNWDIDDLLHEFIQCTGWSCYTYIQRKEIDAGKIRVGLRIIYRPGVRMADAWKSGNADDLSSDEKKALKKAESIAASIRKEYASDLDRERAIHDYLCKILVYEDAEKTDFVASQTMANYALNTGKANCQGYSEAFYLIGTMAGLNVRIQNGSNRIGEHTWNAVKLDGKWYMLDVTANDTNGDILASEAPGYIYFNMGRDLCKSSGYTWEDTWEEADYSAVTDGNYFFYHWGGGEYGAAFSSMRDLTEHCYNMKKNMGYSSGWTMLVNGAKGFEADDFHNSMKKTTDNHGGPTKWTFWYWTEGGHLYIYHQWKQF